MYDNYHSSNDTSKSEFLVDILLYTFMLDIFIEHPKYVQ